jgi:hypothetical protein
MLPCPYTILLSLIAGQTGESQFGVGKGGGAAGRGCAQGGFEEGGGQGRTCSRGGQVVPADTLQVPV